YLLFYLYFLLVILLLLFSLYIFIFFLICFPFPFVNKAVDAVYGPISKPVALLAGKWSSLFQTLPESQPRPASASFNSSLIKNERQLGQPRHVPGIVWLEVPVLKVDSRRGQIFLGAGQDFYLSEGMVVAFGDKYLGRIAKVKDESAVVDLFNRAGQRTGVVLQSEDFTTRAVCIGRGATEDPVIDWIEHEKGIGNNSKLLWRPRPLDAVHLADAGLELGVSRSIGSSARGNYTLVVEHQLPASSEGRVYVAASAIGDKVVAEPMVHHAIAKRILLGDGVYGRYLCAVESQSSDFLPTVVSDHGRVCGEIIEWRGAWGWLNILPPSDWQDRAVSIEEGQVSLFGNESSTRQELFTRGGLGVPRGLKIGPADSGAFVPSTTLDVWLAPQSQPGATQ
ncbi:MAG: hypothetical protein QGF46_05115, partial [Planctomycetota bacterium]|nr:hypothetical protein [Planctomycetota bacterium]